MSLPRLSSPALQFLSHSLYQLLTGLGFQVGEWCLFYADTEQAAHVFFDSRDGGAGLGCYKLSSKLISWGRKPTRPSASWPEAPHTARWLQ